MRSWIHPLGTMNNLDKNPQTKQEWGQIKGSGHFIICLKFKRDIFYPVLFHSHDETVNTCNWHSTYCDFSVRPAIVSALINTADFSLEMGFMAL